MKEVPRPAPPIEAFEIGDELFLRRRDSGGVYLLNPTAAALWRGLDAGLHLGELADLVATTTGVDAPTVRHDFEQIEHEWRRVGLLGDAAVENDEAGAPDTPTEPEEELPPPPPPDPAAVRRRNYRICGTALAVESETPELLALTDTLLGHLATAEECPSATRIRVVANGEGALLCRDGVPVATCSRREAVLPMLHAHTLAVLYDDPRHDLILHAAAVSGRGRCLLFPAEPGSGKSTLAAGLVGEGYAYLADDVVVFDYASRRVRPVPVCLGLKSGSWPEMSRRDPALDRLPRWRRLDGQWIRYLPPPPSKHYLDRSPVGVSHIVFPHFDPDRPGGTERISPGRALWRITEAGYMRRDMKQIERRFVEELVAWISGLPCWTIRYGSLEEAFERIDAL